MLIAKMPKGESHEDRYVENAAHHFRTHSLVYQK